MRVYVDTVGCRLNQAEIELIAQQFAAAGHVLVSVPDEADLAVLNTCTVTAKADADSRSQVRRLQRAGVKHIILTGCWASLRAEEASAFEGVQQVVLNSQKDRLTEVVLTQLHQQNKVFVLPQTDAPILYKGLSGKRHRTRAFIKVQDGCDDHCTFCITRIARGPVRSRMWKKWWKRCAVHWGAAQKKWCSAVYSWRRGEKTCMICRRADVICAP
jgi:threonylcarbamoyladenosine tRNA methylthiotransferase MtaB